MVVLSCFSFSLDFNYRFNNLVHVPFMDGDVGNGFFRSMNQFGLSGDNFSVSTDIWFETSPTYGGASGDWSDRVQLRVQDINFAYFKDIFYLNVGRGFYESSYGYYYKPNYATLGFAEVGDFYNPWIEYAGPTLSIDPSDYFGFDIGFDIYGDDVTIDAEAEGVGDYFIFIRPAFGDFRAQLEYYGFFNGFLEGGEISQHLFHIGLAYDLALVQEMGIGFMVAAEIYDLESAADTGSSSFGVYLNNPASFIKRVGLEGKLIYDKDAYDAYLTEAFGPTSINSGIYADIWFEYENFYGILFYQYDFADEADHRWAFRLGANFDGSFPIGQQETAEEPEEVTE